MKTNGMKPVRILTVILIMMLLTSTVAFAANGSSLQNHWQLNLEPGVCPCDLDGDGIPDCMQLRDQDRDRLHDCDKDGDGIPDLDPLKDQTRDHDRIHSGLFLKDKAQLKDQLRDCTLVNA